MPEERSNSSFGPFDVGDKSLEESSSILPQMLCFGINYRSLKIGQNFQCHFDGLHIGLDGGEAVCNHCRFNDI